MDAAGLAEVVPDDVLVEEVGAHLRLWRGELQVFARHETEQRPLARAHRAIALQRLLEIAFHFELDAAAVAAARVLHLFPATASLAPSARKRAPVMRWSTATRRSLARNQRVPRLASRATATLTSVPWMLKSRPSSRICGTGGPAARSTNCGRKARKKSATLGFSTLVMTACMKM